MAIAARCRRHDAAPDVLAARSNEFSAGVDDSAQFKKDVVWKGERSDSYRETPFRSLCHEFAWRRK